MPNEIRFYRATGEYGYLSNLYLLPAALRFEGAIYRTSEEAYQAAKPREESVRKWMLEAPTASLCAQLAHSLLPWQVSEGWNDRKVERMRAVLAAKFAQHPTLSRMLVETGKAALIEESKTDAFWGVGAKGKGKNMLGVLLMELREELRKNGGGA